MTVTIDVDTGGTFTDGFFTLDSQTATVKVETTPHDLTESFTACLEAGAEKLGFPDLRSMLGNTEVVRFSSTVGTNALIQRNGPRIGLMVSPGNEDSIYGAGASPLFEFLLEEEMVRGVDPDDSEGIRQHLDDLLGLGVRVVVVSLPAAHEDPKPEQRVRAVIRSTYPRHFIGAIPVLCSTDVSRRGPDNLRSQTAVIGAYLHPAAVHTLYRAEDRLRRLGAANPLLISHAAGGAARVAKTVAIDTLNSGPACGVVGAREMVTLLGFNDAVTLDIGGTSTDVAAVSAGTVPFTAQPDIHGIGTNVRQIAVHSVGGGGGSVVRVVDGEVTVGPDSAGSVPGPACYGLGGTDCTVTDANLVGGFLDPNYFLGGRRVLSTGRAAEVVEEAVAGPLGVDNNEAVRLVRATLADIAATEIRRLIGDQDDDVALLAFGGGGGLHATDVAERLGIANVYLSPHGSVFSAFGSSTLDVVHTLEEAPAGRDVASVAAELAENALSDIEVEGLDQDNVTLTYETDAPDGETTTTDDPGSLPGEAALVRVVTTASVPHPDLPVEPTTDGSPVATSERTVFGRPRPVYRREELQPGSTVTGPALVEAEDTTYDVPKGWKLSVDEHRIGQLRRES
ncbi:MAG: hydantoinase/oxoprolinase family protein [Acidimicrobiia bacterium]